ncbi:acyl carrier protein [Acetobacter persici]|uniref:acyl carrier protein n=1 Tax=Acetobacter persici TaxID=1076596 RepID=UPI001BA507AA|nr:acyl carrier protein [Acetobacter persici]MBS1017304.1 acyl carrier protein [Acetobacter persici]
MNPELISKKLTRVFCEAFPAIAKENVTAATVDNTPGWDSLATLTLFTLIEERMDVKIGYDNLTTVKSFLDIQKEIEKEMK